MTYDEGKKTVVREQQMTAAEEKQDLSLASNLRANSRTNKSHKWGAQP